MIIGCILEDASNSICGSKGPLAVGLQKYRTTPPLSGEGSFVLEHRFVII